MAGKPAGVCCYSVPLGVWETGKAVFPGVREAEKRAIPGGFSEGGVGHLGGENEESGETLFTQKL